MKLATSKDLSVAEFESLIEKHGGRIGPSDVVNQARSPSSALHSHFEWDDSIAGEKFRLAQAGQLIRQWKGTILRIEDENRVVAVSVRAVQSPRINRREDEGSYEKVESIMADDDKRDSMIATVKTELRAIRKRHAELTELASVWAAIDAA